jgi:hypothetical protein
MLSTLSVFFMVGSGFRREIECVVAFVAGLRKTMA